MSFDPSLCPKCGRDHGGRCSGHLSSDKEDGRKRGDPCTQWPIHGATKCNAHGVAKGTKGRAAADGRIEAARVETELAKLVGDVESSDGVDALEVLVARLAREARMAGVADKLIDRLATTPGGVDEGGRAVEALYGPDHLGDLRPHPLVAIGQRYSDDAARHAKLALDAGVAERQLALDAGLGQLIGVALAAAFDAVGLTPEQRLAARPAIEAVLRTGAIDATSSEAM